MNKNILFITDYLGMSPFIGSLVNQLLIKGIEADVLDTREWTLYRNGDKTHKLIKKDCKIKYLNRWIRQIKLKVALNKLNYYSAINIFYFQDWLKASYNILKKKTDFLSVSYAGSDFYRISDKQKNNHLEFLNKCDVIIFNNQEMARDFSQYYGNNIRTTEKITGLGLDLLAIFKKIKLNDLTNFKKKYNIPNDSIIITIGYNASKAQQHKVIIKEISKLNLKRNIFVILPLTYGGNDGYKNELISFANNLGIKCKAFTNYLSNYEIAQLRLISDITINMQISDQASHALLEHIYGQNILLVADWLPYSFWDKMGIYFHRVNEQSLVNKLRYVINNLNEEKRKCLSNKEKILNNWGWEKKIDLWIDALGLNYDNNN